MPTRFLASQFPIISFLLRTLLVVPAVPLVPHHCGLVVAVNVLSHHPSAVDDVVVIMEVNPNKYRKAVSNLRKVSTESKIGKIFS